MLLNNKYPQNAAFKYLGLGLIFAFLIIFCSFDIKNFTLPLSDFWSSDTEQWENMSYFLSEHISFFPFPQLDLVNNDHFYPFGSNHAFQGWFLEGNYLFSFFYKLFGAGPWLKYYYAISILTTALGVFFLTAHFFNYQRAILAALLVSFLNFHALNRYPAHYAYSVHHWATLSIFLDLILVRKFVYKEYISIRLLLFKVMIMSLALGLDLAYVLGFALSSFFFSLLFVAVLCLKKQNRVYVKELFGKWLKEIKDWKWVFTGMLAITLIAWWSYIPIILQVQRAVSGFHFDYPAGFTWDMPLRLLFPYFKFFNAAYNPLQEVFHDRPEGLGSLSPGLFMVIIGLIGFIYSSNKDRKVVIPFLVFLLIAIISHPVRWPILQTLPWCKMYRVTSRITIIIPILCAFLFLMGDYRSIKRRTLMGIVGLVSIIAIMEISTVATMRYNSKPYIFADSFMPYMDFLKQQPGEAVLDWPICIAGGNGVGTLENLCPTYGRNSGAHTMKRFHHKKTVGHYYGRLHPSLIEPFLKQGWPQMMKGDDDYPGHSTKLVNSFTPDQWDFFTAFFKKNDFAGINLYTELIPESEIQEFYRRFGKPVKETTIPMAGRVVFIPKPAKWRSEVNIAEGKALKLPCNCPNQE